MKNILKKYKTSFLASLALVSLLSFDSPSDRYYEITKNMEIFTSVYSTVNKYYVDEVNPSRIMKKAIDEMLESLDPYTNYIAEEDIEDYRVMSTGQYGGVGAVIGKRDGKTLILMPYEGFPAHKAGLKIGDEIIKVGEINVEDKTTTEISSLLKGQANTPVEVTIRRFGDDQLKVVSLTREKIKIKNVPYYGMVTETIGYIVLSDFTRDASKEIKEGIAELKKQGATKLILDLRGNPGGLLNEAVAISNLFVDKGSLIVSTKGKVDKWNTEYIAKEMAVDTQTPLVVLTNRRSASASEIVSGVMQDYDRGVLIGKKTYGKGLVQATLPTEHKSQLKVTTAKYYIPSGRCIQAIDYTHRNDDGSVGKIPDSLKATFQTSNGRTVYDGGGVDPDILTEDYQYSEISIQLSNDDVLFEYASEYYLENPEVSVAKEFSLSDVEYDKFEKWFLNQKYQFETFAEKKLDEFEKYAKSDSTDTTFDVDINKIREKIALQKTKELSKNKAEIIELLEEEILSRYYLQKGVTEASFDDDVDIKEAVKLLEDLDRYHAILSRP